MKSKKEESDYEKLESLVSILIDEVAELKNQNQTIKQAVVRLKEIYQKPKRIEYLLNGTGLQKKVDDSKAFVKALVSSVERARSITDWDYMPPWLTWFFVVSSTAFLIAAFTLYCVIDNAYTESVYHDFVYSSESVYEYFLKWKEKQ